MSYIGATGLDENQEQFDILKDEIDANASYINNLVGIPDPFHTAIFGINVLNPGLFGLVERAEVKIKLLETAEEGLGTDVTGLTTQVEGIQTEVTGIQTEVAGIQTEITGIQGEITGIDSAISAIQFVELPALAVSIGLADGIAVDARNKANRALGIWDYSGDNVYHKKSGNVGIGATFGSVLTNKLEVGGNINIPTGSTFRIGDEPFNYSHLAGTQPVSSKWTNATDVNTNIYYNTGNVGIGVTTAINNKLEVNGSLNISAGSKYKINNVDLTFSDLGTLSYNSLSEKPTLFDGNYNSLTNKLTGGTNIQILNGVINNTYTYTLPTATTAVIGGVRPDGTTILINNGVISASATSYTLPVATTSVLGGVRIDGTSIVDVNGSIAAVQVQADWNVTNTLSRAFILNKPNIISSQWTTSGTLIYYNGGNVGIGTNNPISSLHLHKTATLQDVRIQLTDGTTTGGADRGLHLIKGGTTGYLYNYENASLLFGTNGTERMTINNIGNVGIGTNTPNANLHLHGNGASQNVRISFTDNTSGVATTDGFCIGKDTAQVGYIYNTENNALSIGTNNTERMRILGNGNIGIGISPSYKLDVNGNVYAGNNSFLLSTYNGTGARQFFGKEFNGEMIAGMEIENTTLGGNWSQKLHFTTHTYGGGYGRRMTINEGGAVIMTGALSVGGLMTFANVTWHQCATGNGRFYFAPNSTTYIRGYNNASRPIEFRNGGDTPIAYFESDGQFVCSFQTRSVTDTDHLVVANNTNLFAVGQYKIHIAHNTFTGFHRCYYEDDEIFNNDMLKEEIDIFKNNYKGRIVISTGKIKTDFTREVKKETIVEEEPSATQNEEEEVGVSSPSDEQSEEVKIEDITEEEATKEEPPPISSVPAEITTNEWYSAIDKDGITIEDAIPIVQLCRVKKDKRVYGVLGSPTRSTNNINRLIVNSVGEGAICVCNTNGNIENGDYIQSSELLGFGEKQDDDILHNYSVAKAVMDCTFELDSPYYQCYELESGNGSVRVAFIACTYHSG